VEQPLDVSIEADDGKMSMAVERLGSNEDAMATVLTEGDAQFSCDECKLEGADGKPIPQASIFEAKPRTWSVYVKKHSRLYLKLRAVKGGIPAEHEIRLAKGSTVTFLQEGQSAIAGADGEVQITGVDRKPLKLKEGQSLALDGLEGDPREDDPRIVTLEPDLEPKAASVKVSVRGSSKSILLDKSNEAATPAEYLTSQKPIASYFSAVALIGSTILTILTRLKFIKPKD
jgi:hypothetical protein